MPRPKTLNMMYRGISTGELPAYKAITVHIMLIFGDNWRMFKTHPAISSLKTSPQDLRTMMVGFGRRQTGGWRYLQGHNIILASCSSSRVVFHLLSGASNTLVSVEHVRHSPPIFEGPVVQAYLWLRPKLYLANANHSRWLHLRSRILLRSESESYIRVFRIVDCQPCIRLP